jgi:pyruvate dehydrogenase E2 component (dihydrolipoamide acetyltransferase)
MLHSAQSTAPVTLTTRADATNLVSLRRQFQSAGGHAVVPAYHDIVLKIVATALGRHPVLAARWLEGEIVPADAMDIGIAVDTEAGLLVPVVRNVDRLSLREVAVASREVIARALARKCSKQELEGGVFTVSNLGSFGIEHFTPIINSPQAAILGLGAIRREPVVRDNDQIVACDVLPLSLTFDHRVTDGAPAARFLQDVCRGIENPSAWLIE